jgi:preprotein translocase subunit YajC
MNPLHIILIFAIIGIYFFIWSLCRISAMSDERALEMMRRGDRDD